MRTLILSAAIPLFLLGGCSTMQDAPGGHDAHHPKMAPTTQDSAMPAPEVDRMAPNADMMKNCPMMKDGGMTKGAKSEMPMSGGATPGMSGENKMMGTGDDMMMNCPMMKEKATAPEPH